MGLQSRKNRSTQLLNAIPKNTNIVVFLILVLCNIFVWYGCSRLNAGRPLVNVDYVIPFICIIAINRFWAVSLLFLFQFIDLIASSVPEFKTVGKTLALSDVLSLWSLLPVGQFSLLILICGIPCLGVGILLFGDRRINTIRLGVGFILVNALISVGDLLNGSSSILSKSSLLIDKNIAFSASYRISKRLAISRTNPSDKSLTRVDSVLQKYIEKSQYINNRHGGYLSGSPYGQRPRQVLFVIAESLGVLNIDPDRSILFDPLLSLTNKFALELGSIWSTGVTIDAEKREFYGLETSSATDLNLGGKSLLLDFLDAGYELFAFHNYYGAMYDRRRSLMAIGFKNVFFLDEFLVEEPDIQLSGVLLRGATDRAAISRISSLLNSNPLKNDRFIYWLTLSGHLPVDRKYADLIRAPKRFDTEPHQQLPEPVLQHEVIMGGLIDDIYNLISVGSIVGCDVVVVGDHAPPFGDMRLSALYKNNLVPYLIMRCK